MNRTNVADLFKNGYNGDQFVGTMYYKKILQHLLLQYFNKPIIPANSAYLYKGVNYTSSCRRSVV